VLGIAQGAIDRRRIDGDLRVGACLPSLAAAATHGDGDLELRAARGLGVGARSSTAPHSAAMNASSGRLAPYSSSRTMRAWRRSAKLSAESSNRTACVRASGSGGLSG
jgi:hypothetical protein